MFSIGDTVSGHIKSYTALMNMSTQGTHIEHLYQDNMCTTTVTDEELTNDDEDEMGEGEQGGGKAIHARYGNRIQAVTEKEMRRLMEGNSGKYVVYDGKIMTPRYETR